MAISQPIPWTNEQPQVVVYDWSNFGENQKQWPVPQALILIAFFIGGLLAPRLGGRLGITAMFIAAACFPSGMMRDFVTKGRLLKVISVIATVMMLGNMDALGDLLRSETIRFSWISLGLAAFAIPWQLRFLKGRVAACCVVLTLFIGFSFLTSLNRTSVLRAVELNGSYLAAVLISIICLVRKDTRQALAYQLAILAMVNSGFCLFEILFSSSDITISSSRLLGETRRSAGIYANAIVSGIMMSGFLLAITMTCTKIREGAKQKFALIVLTGLIGVGILATFSRSAAVTYFIVAALVAFRIADNRFARFSSYLPFAALLTLLSFFGTGEFLSSKGSLRTDASRRYDAVKSVMTGDLSPAYEAVAERTSAWQPSRKYWKSPRAFGFGYNFISENSVYPPHNMIILMLVEIGWIGLVFYFVILFFFSNFGGWTPNWKNLVLYISVILPVLLLTFESHSFLIRRYFALQMVLLIFTTNVLFDPKALKK